MISAAFSRERYLAYRRSLPSAPHPTRQKVAVRGLAFAVWSTPPVAGTVPLLCINGGLIYGHDLLWPALSPLSRGRQLVFYDQRGRGETQAPPNPSAARIEHDADDVAALRAALGYSTWDVLGHSWGGGIAALAAERDRVGTRRLVLVDAVGPDSSWMADVHHAALTRLPIASRVQLRRTALMLRDADPAIHSAYAQALYAAWFSDPDLAQSFAPPRAESATGSAVASRLHRDGYDWHRLTGAIEARTLVLHGERDLLPPAVAHELSALISQARLELIPGCGHMPFREAPGTFFKIVDSFLSAP